jgi:hypothetical protein
VPSRFGRDFAAVAAQKAAPCRAAFSILLAVSVKFSPLIRRQGMP